MPFRTKRFLFVNSFEGGYGRLKNHSSKRTKEDIFEQMVGFYLFERYVAIKGLVKSLAGKVKTIQDVTKMA